MQIMDVVLSKFALYPSNHIWSILICLRSTHSGCKMHITSLKQNNKIAYFFRHLSQPQMTALFMFFYPGSVFAYSLTTSLSPRKRTAQVTQSPAQGGRRWTTGSLRQDTRPALVQVHNSLSSFLPSCLPACLPVCPLGHFALSLSQQSAYPLGHFALSLSCHSSLPVCPLGHFAISLSGHSSRYWYLEQHCDWTVILSWLMLVALMATSHWLVTCHRSCLCEQWWLDGVVVLLWWL